MLDGAPCKGDNQKCTIGDTCQGGVCIAGEEASLESDNPCVNLVCVKGEVEEQPLSGTCSDGDPCTEGDRCALGQCVPDKLVDCPTTPCASTTWCDSEAGKCLSELKPDGSECESENSCVARATCESGQCVAHETIPCDDGNSCTEDTCELGEGGQPDCAQVTLPDDTVCEGLGYCSGGACVAPGSNQPPSAPAVRVDPAEPTPGAALTCVIDQASVDPEGQTVTYEYSWLRNGEATDHEGETVEAGGTAACETWTCVVTPRAERFPGPGARTTGTAARTG